MRFFEYKKWFLWNRVIYQTIQSLYFWNTYITSNFEPNMRDNKISYYQDFEQLTTAVNM